MSTLSNPLLPAIPALARRRCLAAVALHDARMDGAFVYAVRSTGIYCRPSCPSRRPHAKQILLFVQAEAAEQAGFRACRRCHPRQARSSPQANLVRRVCGEIEGNADGTVSLRSLAERTGLSAAHLQRTFRQAMGITPRQYADALRVARFKSELRKGKDVTTALHEVSYGSSSRLYEKSDAHLGMTPATYRRGGRGMNISYTIVRVPWGGCSSPLRTAASPPYTWEIATRILLQPYARNIRTPKSEADLGSTPSGFARLCATWPARIRGLICQRTSRRQHSSGASGRHCGPSRLARRARIRRLRAPSASPARYAPSPTLARQIPRPSWFRATAWCAPTGRWAVTGGDSDARNCCWSGKKPQGARNSTGFERGCQGSCL